MNLSLLSKLKNKFILIMGQSITLLAAFILSGYLFVFFGLSYVEKWMIVSKAPNPAEAMIVLSGHPIEERLQYAAEIYRQGIARKVILSGHMLLQKETGIDLMQIYIQMLGIPAEDVIRELESATTLENALFSKKIIIEKGYQSVLIVTSPIHTRRARRIFRAVFPDSIQIQTVSAKADLDKPIVKDPSRLRALAHEVMSFIWLFQMEILDKNLYGNKK